MQKIKSKMIITSKTSAISDTMYQIYFVQIRPLIFHSFAPTIPYNPIIRKIQTSS